jgi:hypothetical protein
MSTDGTQSAYWLADSCVPGAAGKLYTGANNTMGESGPGSTPTPNGAIDEPVGIVQQGVVVNDVGGDFADGPTGLLVGWDGTTNRLHALAFAGGSDENNDVVSGQLAGATSTGAVVDVSTGAVKWRAPGWQLGQFSDDGRYVVAQRTDASAGYAILDADTGDQIARLDSLGDNVAIRQVAWDFDDTVLAVADYGDTEAIIRFDLRGHPTRATPTRTVSGGNDAYRLATRP